LFKKIPPGIRVSLIAIWVVTSGWFLFRAFGYLNLRNFEPTPVSSGEYFSLIAVAPGTGYRIIVANEVAQLAEVDERDKDKAMSQQNLSNPKRLPIRDLVESLRGDEKALGNLVMSLNDINQDSLPPVRVIWGKEKLDKAFAGDANTLRELERDLNMRLDGSPLETLNLDNLLRGIVLEIPVEIEVLIGGKPRKMIAKVQEAFLPPFAQRIENRLSERFNPPQNVILGIYREEYLREMDGRRDDLKAAIQARFDEGRLAQLREKPNRILSSAQVLVNETHFEGARYETIKGNNNKEFTNITIRLTEEGRMRLWKYSHDRPGFQLLFIHRGVALAAPRISTELAESEVTITQLPNSELAIDAVESLNRVAGKKPI
jgi:hypothetical protein